METPLEPMTPSQRTYGGNKAFHNFGVVFTLLPTNGFDN